MFDTEVFQDGPMQAMLHITCAYRCLIRMSYKIHSQVCIVCALSVVIFVFDRYILPQDSRLIVGRVLRYLQDV